MTLNRVGKYRLSQHLHSAANIDGYRAVQVDSDGSYVRHVYVCGLRDIADTPDERSDIVGKLSEFRDYLTLPNFLPILDVFDDSASSGFDVVVVSQWCGGCSLARLLDVSAAPGLRLALYVMRVLCTSLSESYRRMTARGQTPPVGVLSADRVWIDHQGTITMHNPFVESGAGGLDDTNTASGRDVAALQYILRGLTNAWVRRADAGSDLPSDVTALLEKAREPGENTLDFLDRFKTAVEEVADRHGAVQGAVIDALGSFTAVFEREATFVAYETATHTGPDAEDLGPTESLDIQESLDRDENPAVNESPDGGENPAADQGQDGGGNPITDRSPDTAQDSLFAFNSEQTLAQEAIVSHTTHDGERAPVPDVPVSPGQREREAAPDQAVSALPEASEPETSLLQEGPASPTASERQIAPAQDDTVLAAASKAEVAPAQPAPALPTAARTATRQPTSWTVDKPRLWPRLMTAAALVVGLVGVSALLFGQVPGTGSGGTENQRGVLDLRGLQVSPSDASVYLVLLEPGAPHDGQVFNLEPGEHELEIRADGHETTRLTVQVTPGEPAVVTRSLVSYPLNQGSQPSRWSVISRSRSSR